MLPSLERSFAVAGASGKKRVRRKGIGVPDANVRAEGMESCMPANRVSPSRMTSVVKIAHVDGAAVGH